MTMIMMMMMMINWYSYKPKMVQVNEHEDVIVLWNPGVQTGDFSSIGQT
jgi:hypothetical protein